jgi:hypothetical protein
METKQNQFSSLEKLQGRDDLRKERDGEVEMLLSFHF